MIAGQIGVRVYVTYELGCKESARMIAYLDPFIDPGDEEIDEIDDTSVNSVLAEDIDDTPEPWDFEGGYPDEVEGEDDGEEEEV